MGFMKTRVLIKTYCVSKASRYYNMLLSLGVEIPSRYNGGRAGGSCLVH